MDYGTVFSWPLTPTNLLSMLKLLRIITGSLLVALLLHIASLAVQDCPSNASSFENCLWLWLRSRLDLPQTRLGRVIVLELVGLALLAGLYLTLRFVFPFTRRRSAAQPARHSDPNPEICNPPSTPQRRGS